MSYDYRYSDGNRIEKIAGHTITKVEISQSKEYLRITTDRRTFVFEAKGDCCSHSWFEAIDDPQAMLGKVVEVEEIDIPFSKTRPEQVDYEYIQYYGVRFTTAAGRATVEYRNSSNGYYGGSLGAVESVPEKEPMNVLAEAKPAKRGKR